MKKFLSLILAAMMILSSVAALAETVPSKTTEDVVITVPSKTTEDVVITVPSTNVEFEDAVVTPEIFVAVEAPEAVENILAAIETAAAPIEAYTAETTAAIEAALEVDSASLVLAAAPIALDIDDTVAAEATKAQVLALSNVAVGEKFVVVLTLTTGEAKEEIVLNEVAANAEVSEVYVVVDLETLAKIQAADTAVITVLTTAIAE